MRLSVGRVRGAEHRHCERAGHAKRLKLIESAGLPRIRLHDIRHTLATLMLKAGEITKVVTERLGHSTTAYTQDAYQEVMPGMQRDAARRFRERLLSEPPDEPHESSGS